MGAELREQVWRCHRLSHLCTGVPEAGGVEGSPQGEQVNERWRGPGGSFEERQPLAVQEGILRDPARVTGIAAREVGRPEQPMREGLRSVRRI